MNNNDNRTHNTPSPCKETDYSSDPSRADRKPTCHQDPVALYRFPCLQAQREERAQSLQTKVILTFNLCSLSAKQKNPSSRQRCLQDNLKTLSEATEKSILRSLPTLISLFNVTPCTCGICLFVTLCFQKPLLKSSR